MRLYALERLKHALLIENNNENPYIFSACRTTWEEAPA
jgi:hypothetical protein